MQRSIISIFLKCELKHSTVGLVQVHNSQIQQWNTTFN